MTSTTTHRSGRRAALAAPAVLFAALDPGSTRLVYAMVAGLVVVGITLIVLGIWIVRQTRYDLPVLAPLERMGDSDWRKRDESTQRRILDDVRPDGAEPLRSELAPPTFDDDFDLSHRPQESVSDLGPGIPSSSSSPPPPPPAPSRSAPTDTPIATESPGDALSTEGAFSGAASNDAPGKDPSSEGSPDAIAVGHVAPADGAPGSVEPPLVDDPADLGLPPTATSDDESDATTATGHDDTSASR